MADPTPPIIQQGQKLAYTKHPFLGTSRVNPIIALYNAFTNFKVNVISQVGNSASPNPMTASQPSFVWTAQGATLTIPIPVTQNGTNTQGWFWTHGARNYDPASTYVEQQLVYVQSTSSVATTGVTDPDSGLPVKSLPGIWVALQPVAGSSNHIPHLPMPTPDDMDATNNYWAFVSPMDSCI